MARRKSAPKVKLRHRLPNAPSIFVGRAAEVEWLDHAIRRAPVVAITGPGGIGKTALTLRVLSSCFPDRVSHTIYFGIRPGEPTAQLRYDLVRVLADAAREDVDLAALAGDPEALTEAAIDLAEVAGLWVVLDDIHHADREEMSELVTQLATYARESRWLLTSRMEPPVPALRGQVLSLHAMHEVDLVTLARDLSPHGGDADLHRAVVASSGSPWLLHQYVATGDAGAALTRERLLGDLTDAIEPFLRTLALFRAPVDGALLAQLAALPDDPTMDTLVRRGLVVTTDAGIVLHDVVAQILYPKGPLSPGGAAERERAAGVLEATGEPDSLVEAARLYLEAGSLDALVALLDAHAETLFEEALAPRLWAFLGEARDPRLVRHQLRCASELGNPTALGAVERPRDPGPEERLAWALTTYAQGEVERARALASELRASAELAGDTRIACEAALLEARTLLHQGEAERAERLLGSRPVDSAGLAFRRDALSARCRAAWRDPTVEASLADLRRRGETSSEGLDGLLDLASALHQLGRHEAADEVLDALLATPRGGRASLLVSRQALLLRARIRLDAGDVTLAGELVASLRPYVRTTSLLRPFVIELDAARRLAIGDLAGLGEAVGAAVREAQPIDRALVLRLATLAERIAVATLEPVSDSASSVAVDPTDVSHDCSMLRATRARRALRAGEVTREVGTDAGVDSAMLAAERAVVGGDVAFALAQAASATREAARHGARLRELDALALQLDLLALAGEAARDAAKEAARAMLELARATSSVRARLFAELAEGFGDPGTLEHLASHSNTSPVAARRARALLGCAPPLDLVDRLVVDAWRRRAPTLRVKTLLGNDPRLDWQPGWGLDARTHRIWLPDGRTIDLSSKSLLWRLLEALAARGGAATKEELVLGVWDERVYHPGRHDPRLHMSARKLREALEDDPGAPARLLTTQDGYRLGGVVRRIASDRDH